MRRPINSRQLAELEPDADVPDIFVDMQNHVFWLKSLSSCQYTCQVSAFQSWFHSVSATPACSLSFGRASYSRKRNLREGVASVRFLAEL